MYLYSNIIEQKEIKLNLFKKSTNNYCKENMAIINTKNALYLFTGNFIFTLNLN